MPKRMIHQHNRQHCFCDGRRADPNTGIMPAKGNDFDGVSEDIDRTARQAQARGRALQSGLGGTGTNLGSLALGTTPSTCVGFSAGFCPFVASRASQSAKAGSDQQRATTRAPLCGPTCTS